MSSLIPLAKRGGLRGQSRTTGTAFISTPIRHPRVIPNHPRRPGGLGDLRVVITIHRAGTGTEVELVMSCRCSGGSDGQAGLGEASVYEVAAVLDVPQAASDALHEVFRRAEGDIGGPA